jgi:nitroimidazol reductase NimA-like FMN-containing flavoprotein (pyridoxamine 5'-phosphate oxidase superfamily)
VTLLAADPVRTGHRRLLETFRELQAELAEPVPGCGTARAAVAFLRESLLPFAQREEAVLGVVSADLHGVALDHAFIAAEVDALAAEVRERGADPAAVRRRLYRLEAVLELHLAREEERDPGFVVPPAPSVEPAAAAVPRAMDPSEVGAFLATREWGMLATLGEAGPYAVPVGYGWDGRDLFFASGPGRKLRHLERDPTVCLTVAEVESGDRWRCVVAAGVAEAVAGPLERVRALRHIHRQSTGSAPTAADLVRAARARVFRVRPRELTGRVRG